MIKLECVGEYYFYDGVLDSYELKDKSGNMTCVKKSDIIRQIKHGDIEVTNLKIVFDDILIYSNDMRFEQLELYVNKQILIGKVFDFFIDLEKQEICITKYYDVPHRKEVIIPDFVSKIKTYKEFSKESIFQNCENVEKVVMHSNVQGRIGSLFKNFRGTKLDLSDFDTSNITDMFSMFYKTEIGTLILGEKFDTSNVTDMSFMFSRAIIRELIVKNCFKTCCLSDTADMFSNIQTDCINLGDNFDTTRIRVTTNMFGNAQIRKELYLGDSFKVDNKNKWQLGFSNCSASKIIVRNDMQAEEIKCITDTTHTHIQFKNGEIIQ